MIIMSYLEKAESNAVAKSSHSCVRKIVSLCFGINGNLSLTRFWKLNHVVKITECITLTFMSHNIFNVTDVHIIFDRNLRITRQMVNLKHSSACLHRNQFCYTSALNTTFSSCS